MSKEVKPKKPRSTKKVADDNTAQLEAKIAELEAKLSNLSSQVKPAETKPAAQTAPKPAPAPAPKPRPAASGPTHGTLPAGMKPTPPPAATVETFSYSTSAPEVGEVAPAYAKTSSTGYTGNKYYATRARLSYHPANKQFKGSTPSTSESTYSAPPPPPAPKPQRGTLPAGMKPAEQHHVESHADAEKKSMWKAKGSEYENYVSEETHKAPPPQHAEAPKPAPAPAPKPRPAASGPTHGTLPAGMKPTPPPKAETYSTSAPEPGEVAPAYAQISSSGYTGNRYFATRRRLSYHPPNKQFTGSASAGMTEAPPAPAPAPKKSRGTLPAGFKP